MLAELEEIEGDLIQRSLILADIEVRQLLESSRHSITQRMLAPPWAAMLAFPTAVAGSYGMNVRHMPEPTREFGSA